METLPLADAQLTPPLRLPSSTSAWLEVALGKQVTFSRAAIRQAFPELNRIHKLAVEYLQDGQRKLYCQGADPGEKFSATFPPVTAQRVRLNLLDAIRKLATPPAQPLREIGFHTRDGSVRYRVRKR